MSRLWAATLGVVLLAPACKVEPTPRPYFDQQVPTERERASAADEVRDRLLALAQAMSRGDAVSALEAFSPAPDAYVLGPAEGTTLSGAEQLDSVLQGLSGGAYAVTVRDLQVQVGPRANLAWFRMLLDVPARGGAPAGSTVRATGVYVLNEGVWQLVQAHLSYPASLSSLLSSPASAGDSLGAGSPAGAPATPEGGSSASGAAPAGSPAVRQ